MLWILLGLVSAYGGKGSLPFAETSKAISMLSVIVCQQAMSNCICLGWGNRTSAQRRARLGCIHNGEAWCEDLPSCYREVDGI